MSIDYGLSAPARGRERGVSRRRVVQGVAWSVPAVLIATAAPAAAASLPGNLVLASVGANQDTSRLQVSMTVSYMGDGAPRPDYPVTGITAKITVPTARIITPASATTTSPGWTLLTSGASGANTVFTFGYTGSLSASGSTTQLTAQIPKNDTITAFTLQVQAQGTSHGANVSAGPQSVSVGAYSLMTFNSAPNGYVDGAGTNPRYVHLQGAILNAAGWPNNNTADVVNVVASVTVATAEVGPGTPAAESWAPAWTYASTQTSGANTIYNFNLVGGTLATSNNPTQFAFRIPRRSAGTAAVPYTVAFSGKSPNASGAASTLSAVVSI